MWCVGLVESEYLRSQAQSTGVNEAMNEEKRSVLIQQVVYNMYIYWVPRNTLTVHIIYASLRARYNIILQIETFALPTCTWFYKL